MFSRKQQKKEKEWTTIKVNQIVKRGNFPSNLRLKRIYNSQNIFGQFLPNEEDDIRPFAGRCKSGTGKRILLQKSMETDDINLAAKRSIKWVEEVIQNNLNKKSEIIESGNNLSKYWDRYFSKERELRINERNFKRWEREELLKWNGEEWGLKHQQFSKISADKISLSDFREYFDLLEKRSRQQNGSNGSGMKSQQKTLINKLLLIANDDFIGHNFPPFPSISKQVNQVRHLTIEEWTKLTTACFDLTNGKELLTYSPKDYEELDYTPYNRKNIRNFVDLFDALMLQWFFYLRAEDMYRLKTSWFREQDDGTWVCNLETTKKDRPKHITTHYRPETSYIKRIINRKKDFEYVIFPFLKRPSNNELDSSVLSNLNFLLKHTIEKCLPDFPIKERKWTTIRHTAFRLTLEEFPDLGIPPYINSFADNGHTSPDMLRRTYINYIQSEKVSKISRKKISATKNVRFGGKFKSKKDIEK